MEGVDEAPGILADEGLKLAIERLEHALGPGRVDPMIPFAEALSWVYSLEEWHKRRLTEQGRDYFAIRAASPEGEVTAAVTYARSFVGHELARVGDVVNTGTLPARLPMPVGGGPDELVWRHIPPQSKPDKHGRDALYSKLLAGRNVQPSLRTALRFLESLP